MCMLWALLLQTELELNLQISLTFYLEIILNVHKIANCMVSVYFCLSAPPTF